MKFEIYGANHEPSTFFCHDLAKKIAKVLRCEEDVKEEGVEAVVAEGSESETKVETRVPIDVEIVFQSYLEIDYMKKLKHLQREGSGAFYHHRATEVVIVDGKYIGNKAKFIEYAQTTGYVTEGAENGNEVVHNRLAREEFLASTIERGNKPMVYMEFADGSKFTDETTPVYGKVIIELFNDVVPLAANNFLMLSTGQLGATEMAKLHYQGSPVHRVVQGGWMQGGDIVLGNGGGSWAAVGKEGKVQDESFVCDFSNPLGGIVGFSTSTAHSIGSQFFITLGACEWMNGEYVGVGRVICGFETLRRIDKCSTTNQKPDPSIICSKSGKHVVM
jgi:cyclophilin family peptidyl-prolyl cis-trans isomerase